MSFHSVYFIKTRGSWVYTVNICAHRRLDFVYRIIGAIHTINKYIFGSVVNFMIKLWRSWVCADNRRQESQLLYSYHLAVVMHYVRPGVMQCHAAAVQLYSDHLLIMLSIFLCWWWCADKQINWYFSIIKTVITSSGMSLVWKVHFKMLYLHW